MGEWQAARLIPVKGIATTKEAEERATSAVLAVMSMVRDLSSELFSPLGASRAKKALVETYTEVQFDSDGRTIRPDGLVRVSYGSNAWTALVEVKTGDSKLELEQIENYLKVARKEGFDYVVTISNEIAPAPGVHPTEGAKVRANSRVRLAHISWTALVATAVTLKVHHGVTDPEQAWLLAELIRYLEHPASGALRFDDMGGHWVAIRNAARNGALSRSDEGVLDVCQRWDQLMRFNALMMGAETGEDVQIVVPRKHRQDQHQRTQDMAQQLAETGQLEATVRIPKTAGDLTVRADLKARQLTAETTIKGPEDRGAKARVTWLMRQLKNAPATLEVEARPARARMGNCAPLAVAMEDPYRLLDDERREPATFTLRYRTEMGMARGSGGGTKPGFIDSVESLVNGYYDQVLSQLTVWQPKPSTRAYVPEDPDEAEPTHDPQPAEAHEDVV